MMGSLFHIIKLRDGRSIRIPSSLPDHLQKYIDLNHLEDQDKIDRFKDQIDQLLLSDLIKSKV
jgi:hypothetical protein